MITIMTENPMINKRIYVTEVAPRPNRNVNTFWREPTEDELENNRKMIFAGTYNFAPVVVPALFKAFPVVEIKKEDYGDVSLVIHSLEDSDVDERKILLKYSEQIMAEMDKLITTEKRHNAWMFDDNKAEALKKELVDMFEYVSNIEWFMIKKNG